MGLSLLLRRAVIGASVGVLTLFITAGARAAIFVDFATSQVNATEYYVDVTVTSDASDVLDIFFIEVHIDSDPDGFFTFATLTVPEPQFVSPLYEAEYVFAGNSAVFDLLGGSAGSLNGTNDTYFGGDFTSDQAGVTLSATPKLLARINITASSEALDGQTFAISVVDSLFEAPQNVVPEPASLAIWGSLACASLIFSRWRRQRIAR